MQMGPHLPHEFVDLEPLQDDQDPKIRRQRQPKWALLKPPTSLKTSSHKAPPKALPPVNPPPAPAP